MAQWQYNSFERTLMLKIGHIAKPWTLAVIPIYKTTLMRRQLFILLTLLTSSSFHSGFCQNNIDLEEIKVFTQDSTSEYFYDSLIQEFQDNPSSFGAAKGLNIYYGKLFSKYYKTFNFSEDERKFNEFLSRRNFKKAIPLGEQILKNDPVNFEIIFKLVGAYSLSD